MSVTKIFLSLWLSSVAAIHNLNVERSIDLMEQGSSLVTFLNEIEFANPNGESDYYYAIAKDFEWSFVALHSFLRLENDDLIHLNHEPVTQLPSHLSNSNLTSHAEKLILFKISIPSNQPISKMAVYEYHKGRREPYPKTIKVYEKQTVELYESKYFLSVYNTDSSSLTLKVASDDVKHFSEAPS
jgi:hypothetical protein